MIALNKKILIDQFKTLLAIELASLTKSVDAAAEAATHEESKPENKYDTFGLEASYLAGAQKDRLKELRSNLYLLGQMKINAFSNSDRIQPTALVELESAGEISLYLLLILGPGYRLQCDGRSVLTLTTQSPLGRSLLGKTVGDSASIKTKLGIKEYEIINLC